MATLIVPVLVPISGDGIAVDVSSLVGEKTVTLSGTFKGQYVLLGSHNGIHFSPLVFFNSGGVEQIVRTFKGAVAWIRLRSMATESSGVTVNVAGLSIPGNNSFSSLASLGLGSIGPQPSIDLGLVQYQGDVNFIAQGGVRGSVVVEGSLDNIGFNPIGAFSAGFSSPLGGSLVFSPLSTDDRIRYVRLNVRGTILTPFEVTIGGSQSSSGGGAGDTLRVVYEAGIDPSDQIMTLKDSLGGKVVFNATDPGFTDYEVVQVVVPGGEGAAFLKSGGMILGPAENIVIGTPGSIPTLQLGTSFSVAIGTYSILVGGTAVAIGINMSAVGSEAIAIGSNCNSLADESVSVGYGNSSNASQTSVFGIFSNANGQGSLALGYSSNASGQNSLALGHSSAALGVLSVVVGPGAIVNGTNGVALGDRAEVDDNYSVAIGPSSLAHGPADLVIGTVAFADSVDGWNVVIGNQAGSSGMDAVVIGDYAQATQGFDMIVIGHGAAGAGVGSIGIIAIGSYAFSMLDGSIAIGSSSDVEGAPGDIAIGVSAATASLTGLGSSIAIGERSWAEGPYAIAIGLDSLAENGSRTVALGQGASSLNGDNMIAIGAFSQASSTSVPSVSNCASIAIGLESRAYGDTSIAFGPYASTGVDGCVDNIAIGNQSVASIGVGLTSGNISLGAFSNIQGNSSVAIGSNSSVVADSSIAAGFGAFVGGDNGVAVGESSDSGIGSGNTCLGSSAYIPGTGNFNTCLGVNSSVTSNGDSNVCIGDSALVEGLTTTRTVTIGASSSVNDDSSIAIGYFAEVNGSQGIAIGSYALATFDGIAIGYGAASGAGEVVFSSILAGGVNKFEVVSDVAGNPDLFTFLSTIANIDETGFYLLRKSHTAGTIELKQVTLTAPVGGLSLLQVANT